MMVVKWEQSAWKRRDIWCRNADFWPRFVSSSVARCTSASYKDNVNVMVLCTSPNISSAAAYSRWCTNDLRWNMVSPPWIEEEKEDDGSDAAEWRQRVHHVSRPAVTQIVYPRRCFTLSFFRGCFWRTERVSGVFCPNVKGTVYLLVSKTCHH